MALTARPALAGGEVLSYSWDFDDDGSIDAVTPGARVEHAYAAGAHRARVVVDTSLGRSGTFAVTFHTTSGTSGGVAPSFTG
jgi:hypothetical protein